MVKIKIVTGYVPILNHPRKAEEYGRLGESLFKTLNAPVRAYYQKLEQCWLWQHIAQLSFSVRHSEGDNPAKNTLAYHCVNHQKTEWLEKAAREDKDADTFVWIDYGAAHQRGVLPEVVNAFLSRVGKGDLAIPGCWEKTDISMDYPNWRFCGSLLIVPREYVDGLNSEMKAVAKRKIETKRRVDWEVNTLARVERLTRLPIRWYLGDHNATQFTNYRAPDHGRDGPRFGAMGEHGPDGSGVVPEPQTA